MTERDKRATTNLEMNAPLGWRQRVLLIAIRDLLSTETLTTTKEVVLQAARIATKYAVGDTEDISWFNLYLDKGWSIHGSFFYRDCTDTMLIMRRKGWISQVDKKWIIEEKFIEKVNALKEASFKVTSIGRR